MSVSILVVDDEPDVADLLRQRFRREARDGAYVMYFAGSGEAALDQLAEEIEPELIVLGHQHGGHGWARTLARGQAAAA